MLKKVHRVIKFNQKGWFKLYIDMNSGLKQKTNWERFFQVNQ